MEKPVFEVSLSLPSDFVGPFPPAREGNPYTEPFETLAWRLGIDELFIVQETEARTVPSARALQEATSLAKVMAARWFLCTHESTLGTTPSEIEHARALVRQSGARLQFLVPSPWGGTPPTRSCAARLQEHLDYTGWSPQILSSILGLTELQLAEYLAGAVPTEEQIRDWAATLGLSREWLSGATPHPRWGVPVQVLGQTIARVVCTMSDLPLEERMRQVLRLAEVSSPLCRTQWFLPGLMGVDLLQYRRFVRSLSPATPTMIHRLCAAFDISLAWLEGRGLAAHSLDSPHPEAIVYHVSRRQSDRREVLR